jgi:rubrerythrin
MQTAIDGHVHPARDYRPDDTRMPKKRSDTSRRRRRRRAKASVAEIIERSLQNEYRSISLLLLAADKAQGPVSSLFRRMAKEEEYQLEYFKDWYDKLPVSDEEPEDLEDDRQLAQLAMEVQIAQLPDDDRAILDFVLARETEHRDFYLRQRQEARGKKLRTILLDLADEENIHIDQLRQAGGYPPQPKLNLDDM